MLKKFDLHHWSIVLTFFVGLGILVVGLLQGLPAGITPMQAILLLAPAFIAIPNTISAFFKNPPKTPEQALEEGEHAAGDAAGAKAGQRGFGRVGLVGALALIGAVAILACAFGAGTVATTGCTPWWSKNQQTVVQDVDADAQCVLGAVLAGAQTAAAVIAKCVSMTEQQVLSLAANLFNFYVLGQQDGGAPGVALPPYRGIPAALPSADIAKLRAFAGS